LTAGEFMISFVQLWFIALTPREYLAMKLVTLCFCQRSDKILLGVKKRGFNAGNWNGYGGKVESGETVTEAMVREIRDESGLIVKKEDLEYVSLLNIFYGDARAFACHTFITREWEGEPIETEEVGHHQWFPAEKPPFENMRKGDALWLPDVLRGAKLEIYIQYDAGGNNVETITTLPLQSIQTR